MVKSRESPKSGELEMALPPGCNNIDLEATGADEGRKRLCEGCMENFWEIGPELAIVPEIDPDLHWCEACRAVCKCGHIRGVHATVVRAGSPVNGCDGNHGEPGECKCRGFVAKVPAAAVDRAKGIWLSESYRRRLKEERVHA